MEHPHLSCLFPLLCCCFLPKNIVYLINSLFYSAVCGFRKIDTSFVWSVHFSKLVCDQVCPEKIPFLGWPAERAVSIQWKCRLGHGQRWSSAHSALSVAVTVRNESFWQHCRGDFYLARLWLKAEVLPSTTWACHVSAYQGQFDMAELSHHVPVWGTWSADPPNISGHSSYQNRPVTP